MNLDLYRKIQALRSASPRDAAHQCEEIFGPALQRVVRRVIRAGRTRDSLTRSIMQQVHLVRNLYPDLHRDDMVTEVTRRLCARLAGQDCGWQINTIAAGAESTMVPAGV